jgi:predicted regulator of Ras-like GTPase activity (Roadblock/LC7/MglB family)
MELPVATRRGLVITDRQLDSCDALLWELKGLLDCSFLALVTTAGQPITTASDEDHPETLSLASLTAGAFAATRQLAEILNEKEFTLLFHEGNSMNLHVAQATEQVLLLVTFGPDVPIGKVRLYTQRAIVALGGMLQHSEADGDPQMDAQFEVTADRRIDEVFRDDASG